MTLDQIALLAPVGAVIAFFLIEKVALKVQARPAIVTPIAVLQCLNWGVTLGLSYFLLLPLVTWVAPFQVFSLAQWQVPVWVSFTASLLLLDAVQYGIHRLHHQIPWLWRLHRLHHSDAEVDALTTLRHHPLELVSGFFIVVSAAVLFDVPTIALMTYSVAMGVHAAWTHVGVALPEKVDRALKWLCVTPNFHRVHHAQDLALGNAHFGAVFVFWDYLFGTVAPADRLARQLPLGVAASQAPAAESVGQYLMNPLK